MPSSNPLVSIIIPTYNRAHLIGETLDSVLAQTYQNWECIVVDDGSTDNTDEVMAAYMAKDARFQYHHRPKDRLPGGNAARNYGFEVSKGEYIQWFDDDDVMLIDFLSSRLLMFSTTIEVVIGSGLIVDSLLNLKRQVNLVRPSNLYKQYALWKFEIYTKSVLFKRNILKKYSFDETLVRGQETDFFSRIFYDINESQYAVLNKPIYLYRQHDGTKTEKSKNYDSKIILSIAKNHLRSLERAMKLGDRELMNYSYKKILKLLNTALKKSDRDNCIFILHEMKFLLKPNNNLLYYKILVYSKIGGLNKWFYSKIFLHLKYNLPKL
ncbi:glycosyltransferase family 2 protein [Aequorivita sp. 609]|uniref:glycosyltransferase family 2 protein n=1 Tax=Aequorivita TaxID=153265 RepID=UPI001615F3DD|nr:MULTISPECIES: glycosyltransferase family 2 protein [Aequorivita]MBB6681126.1 glycosyltransferase family 2 protein [Aequorivita sp. 609]